MVVNPAGANQHPRANLGKKSFGALQASQELYGCSNLHDNQSSQGIEVLSFEAGCPSMHGQVNEADVSSSALGTLTEEQTERLSDLLDRYLASLEVGEPISREDLLAEHADLCEPLALYLDKLNELHNFSAGFSPQLGGGASSGFSPFSRSSIHGAVTRSDRANPTPGDHPLGSTKKKAEVTGFDSVPADMLAAAESLQGRWGLSGDSSSRRLGDFELLRVIGRGGMGIVYEAEQISLRRRVALKLLPLTSLLDARQIARFKNEAQAAATLQHPNIVPVFAVGSVQGIHYYAMPLIDGYPLDAIIAALRRQKSGTQADATATQGDPSLPTDAESEDLAAAEGWTLPTDVRRVIRIGMEAASALAAAHEEGIIHRDIKPSNLLIDKSGKLWVTDFGLARRTNDQSLTATGDVLGTWRYMSPEQATGQAALVDARSDIYSLAITLYELLTLTPAVNGVSSPGLRAIEHHPPVAIRHVRADLPRDLVTVLEKAMAKDPYERYHTAQGLADDLLRVLEGRPTLAKPPALVTRLAKWAMRHRRLVTAAALVVMIACISLGISSWVVVRKSALAQESVRDARIAWDKLHRAMDRTHSEIVDDLKDIPGAEHVRRNLLHALLESYRDFIDKYRDKSFIQRDVATAVLHSAMLHFELGDPHAALKEVRQAESLYQSLLTTAPDNREIRRMMAVCANHQGRVLALLGEREQAEIKARSAVELQQMLANTDSDSTELIAELVESRNNLALLLAEMGKGSEAEELLEAARKQITQLLVEEPQRRQYQKLLAATYNNLCSVTSQRDPAAAADLYERSLDVLSQMVNDTGERAPPRRQMAITYSNLGSTLAHAGQMDRALKAYDEAISIQRGLIANSPSHRGYLRELSVSLNNLGSAQMRQNRRSEAKESLTEAVALQERLFDPASPDARAAHNLGGTYNNLATLLQSFSDRLATDQAFERAVAYQRQAHDAAPKVALYREFLDNHLRNYADWLTDTQRDERALAIAEQRRILWSGNAHQLVLVASDLADAALDIARDGNRQGVAQRYADAAMETLDQAQSAGLLQSHGITIQRLLAQQPFSSLAKLKSPTD